MNRRRLAAWTALALGLAALVLLVVLATIRTLVAIATRRERLLRDEGVEGA